MAPQVRAEIALIVLRDCIAFNCLARIKSLQETLRIHYPSALNHEAEMQELTETEAAIFTVAQNNADMSIKELAKRARVKQHTARYALNKLIEQKRLQLFPLIRFSRLGINTFIITLTLRGDTPIDTVMGFLRKVEGCSWTGFYSGALTIEAWFLAESPTKLQKRVQKMVESLKGAVAITDMTLVTGYRFYGRRYFTSPLFPLEPLESEIAGNVRLEHNDHLALQMLQAQCIGVEHKRKSAPLMPDSTLRYRLARLRKEGILACVRLTVAQALRTREMIGIYISAVKNYQKLDQKLDAWARTTPELVSICSGLGNFERKVSIEVKKDSDALPVINSLLISCGDDIGLIESRILIGIGTHAAYPFKNFPFDAK
jgi:DNA-binding Lrp family transcriptional regulator